MDWKSQHGLLLRRERHPNGACKMTRRRDCCPHTSDAHSGHRQALEVCGFGEPRCNADGWRMSTSPISKGTGCILISAASMRPCSAFRQHRFYGAVNTTSPEKRPTWHQPAPIISRWRSVETLTFRGVRNRQERSLVLKPIQIKDPAVSSRSSDEDSGTLPTVPVMLI